MRPGNHNFKEAQTTLEFLLGPVKIKDGLFMGDQFAAKVTEVWSRISNSSSATKSLISLTLSQKAFLISMNALEFSISLFIGQKEKKMYTTRHLDFW